MPDSSSFAPNSYFFTDPSAITQSAAQAFGPVSADEYRITTLFDVADGTNAYAVCTSVVLVQPQADDNSKVNLILRPYKQPILGLNIKYFIYRGLDKTDFFDGDNVIAASSETSDFINKINESFAAYYTHIGEDKPDFSAKFIGFDEANQPDTLPISSLFFKQTEYTGTGDDATETPETAFELPVIAAGASLGSFAGAGSGFDIVLNYGDYSLPTPNDEFVFDLAYARKAEATIDIAAETDDYKKKVIKEQIFQFLDAAAYYGFHYRDNGVVVVKGETTDAKKTNEAIYTDIVQKFSTKNRLYIYIQSDRTRSYNFYGNYNIDDTTTNSLKIGTDDGSLTAIAYGTNGWPLLINENPQDTDEPRNNLFLQFVTDNNPNTVLYGYTAQIDNAQGNNFCGPDDLKLPDAEDGTPSTLTKIVNISNASTGDNGAKLNVANFNILLYQGAVYDFVTGQRKDNEGNIVDIVSQPNFFDDVFGESNATALLKATPETQYFTFSMQKLNLVNHFYNDIQYGISATQTIIVNDVVNTGDLITPTLNRVTYITESVDILNNVTSISGTVAADTKSSSSVSGGVTNIESYQLPDPFYFDLLPFTDYTLLINGLLLKTTDNSVPNRIILGLTKAENDLLNELINLNSLTNARLFIIDMFTDAINLISTENVVYKKYQAALLGETISGELKLVASDVPIMVYSIDRKCYFTKGYVDYVEYEPIKSLYLDLEISL
ncbi:hypothetical protein [Mucilaginibacter sp. L3T2-6]|uniref:hypothetical protein n=1 Tax=Mucilaginibacter sp. L3T2-6 TaxID=3062491 RepID=UPI0026754373|nr:hypothetical protein [Mucilaginibacter sp. L3T2-6]MDO3641334.1 hypothetical protein [Mucilaginibacter sp. L3T2-6]MDV6213905.1 hypothetical protein [Mucilaginibacter sp. L3T2-6]